MTKLLGLMAILPFSSRKPGIFIGENLCAAVQDFFVSGKLLFPAVM